MAISGFFGSLLVAGFTSLISILEVIIAAVQDKLGLGRVAGTLAVGIPMAILSTLGFSTTTGLNLLDVSDKFVNSFGIVVAALVGTLVLSYVIRGIPALRDHLNMYGSFKVGDFWYVMISVIAPAILAVTLVLDAREIFANGYGGMPSWFVNTFGWGMAATLVALAIIMSAIPWPKASNAGKLDSDGDPIAESIVRGKPLEVPTPDTQFPQELRADDNPARAGLFSRLFTKGKNLFTHLLTKGKNR